ncbi:MAG: site-specific integrase [Sulfurovum sp.]|nr:site-specific integrase [Sulfurovum sp.]
MAQTLIKINLPNRNCKGLYLVDIDDTFSGVKEINSSNAPKKFKQDFKLVLRLKKDGKPMKKTFTFSKHQTLLQAIDSATEQRSTVFEPKEKKTKVPTLDEYWERYVKHKETTVNNKESWKTSTAKDMKSFYNAWIKPSKLSKMLLTDITREDIESLISKIKKQRSLRTAKKVVEALSPLMKRYYKENKINELNPAEIDVGDLNNVREVVVSLPEVKKLYDAMLAYPVPKYRHVFTWLATGRRLNEVLSLSIKDIDLDKGMFDIHQDNSKSGKKLTFVLRPEMFESLEDKTNLIHPSEKDTVMNGSTIRHHWKKVLETAGLKDLHIHDLRHIIATILRDSGITEEVSALVLGHTRSSITARYASANAKLADSVYSFFLQKVNGEIDPDTKWVEV